MAERRWDAEGDGSDCGSERWVTGGEQGRATDFRGESRW